MELTLENDLSVSVTFENIVKYLGGYRGMMGVPLPYMSYKAASTHLMARLTPHLGVSMMKR